MACQSWKIWSVNRWPEQDVVCISLRTPSVSAIGFAKTSANSCGFANAHVRNSATASSSRPAKSSAGRVSAAAAKRSVAARSTS